jgi:hypothetical protein
MVHLRKKEKEKEREKEREKEKEEEEEDDDDATPLGIDKDVWMMLGVEERDEVIASFEQSNNDTNGDNDTYDDNDTNGDDDTNTNNTNNYPIAPLWKNQDPNVFYDLPKEIQLAQHLQLSSHTTTTAAATTATTTATTTDDDDNDNGYSISLIERALNERALNERALNERALNERALTSDGRVHYNPSIETIRQFTNTVKPSTTDPNYCAWIQVHNPFHGANGDTNDITNDITNDNTNDNTDDWGKHGDYKTSLKVIEDIIGSKPKATVSKRVKDDVTSSILRIAEANRYTTGKWMVFSDAHVIDGIWSKIATAVVEGKLDCSAKVSPMKGVNDKGLICIYCSNFTDKRTIKRVLLYLKNCLDIHVKTGFKPDIFTALGINSGNVWRLNPVIYTVKEVLEWDD